MCLGLLATFVLGIQSQELTDCHHCFNIFIWKLLSTDYIFLNLDAGGFGFSNLCINE